MNVQQAISAFRADRAQLERRGIFYQPGAEPMLYTSNNPDLGADFSLAMDALPTLMTDPNAGIPSLFAATVDPQVYEIYFAPNKAAEILGGDVQRGSWTDKVIYFPQAEVGGEVSSYGDHNNSGEAFVNMEWPTRQSYLCQGIRQWGDLEADMAAAARINIVAEKDRAVAISIAKFMNSASFFGIAGLECWGLLNDPALPASLTPGPKGWGGTTWMSGGIVRATANEIFNDIQAMFLDLVGRSAGRVDRQTPMVLAIGPMHDGCFTQTNSFNVSVADLLTKNFPALKVVTAVQYEVRSAANPQGIVAGNFMQLIAPEIEGQKTAFPAYNERMRGHPIIREMSAYRAKTTSGTWGTVIRMPFAISSMIGI